MRKIRLFLGTHPTYTRVVDVETNEELTNVKRIDLSIDADNHFASAVITAFRMDEGGIVFEGERAVFDVWEATIVEVRAA